MPVYRKALEGVSDGVFYVGDMEHYYEVGDSMNMDFDEVWERIANLGYRPEKEAARLVWGAAVQVERQACIDAIKAADDCQCGVPYDCFGAGSAIAAIKARSKTPELTRRSVAEVGV